MPKYIGSIALAVLTLFVAGCGGSAQAPASTTIAQTEFAATLPDDSGMSILVDDSSNGDWSGSFFCNVETGPEALQGGTFSGTISNGVINATCEAIDGTTIGLSGKSDGNGLDLTRSDYPNTVLKFKPLVLARRDSSSTVSFKLTQSLKEATTSGTVTISTAPIYTSGDASEYAGTCTKGGNSFPAEVCCFTDGTTLVFFYILPESQVCASFSNLPLSKLGMSTVVADYGQDTITSKNLTKRIRYRPTFVAGPP